MSEGNDSNPNLDQKPPNVTPASPSASPHPVPRNACTRYGEPNIDKYLLVSSYCTDVERRKGTD